VIVNLLATCYKRSQCFDHRDTLRLIIMTTDSDRVRLSPGRSGPGSDLFRQGCSAASAALAPGIAVVAATSKFKLPTNLPCPWVTVTWIPRPGCHSEHFDLKFNFNIELGHSLSTPSQPQAEPGPEQLSLPGPWQISNLKSLRVRLDSDSEST
jgi:hypothetical protein